MSHKEDNSLGAGTKIIMIIAVVAIVLFLLARFILSIIPTVGGSFGYGFPSGPGKGRAIRDVVIDVDPQVVYRIDDHRFFTLEQYKDCTSGGLVYYNDTRKKL
ncbi:T6SS immunity protein Tli3 family protein, partial [Chimaeribacter arupi]|uniref:T6SS immunity protein Tli3 family protein n=1 Tax=Chimaeribacter arupi TaxID=2060066 RepID=UPI000CB661D4